MATSFRSCRTDDLSGCCFDCGHIVFAESPVVHEWLVKRLVESGVPKHRIAVLNARRAKDPETRQQVAEGFNGVGCPDDPEYAAPKYDIVIANGVAYEGIDLQARTCAIHHIDIPWEPATLQQRNGRGVRQGNTFGTVRIFYYLAKASLDPRRLSKIDAKASWMTSLVSGQGRVTNNPARGTSLSLADIFEQLANPEQRARLQDLRREEASRAKAERTEEARIQAGGLLRRANQRFRAAERSRTPAVAIRLREQGDELVTKLEAIHSDVWPWFSIAARVRDEAVYVPPKGPPLVAGLRLRVGGFPREVGRIPGSGNLAVQDGPPKLRTRWTEHTTRPVYTDIAGSLDQIAEVPFEDIYDDASWPETAKDRAAGWAHYLSRMEKSSRTWWSSILWVHAPWSLRDELWEATAPVHARWVQRQLAPGFRRELVGTVPVEVAGRLVVIDHSTAFDDAAAALAAGELLPFTRAGWRRFVELVPEARASSRNKDGIRVRTLDSAAARWWGLRLPRAVTGTENGGES